MPRTAKRAARSPNSTRRRKMETRRPKSPKMTAKRPQRKALLLPRQRPRAPPSFPRRTISRRTISRRLRLRPTAKKMMSKFRHNLAENGM